MSCAGVNGPVIFNVANGTYNEQLNITNINGSSLTNNITFRSASGNASQVTLSNAPGSGNFVLNLNGADFITFSQMTISNLNTTGSLYNVIQFTNGADNNTIRGCVVTNATPTQGNLIFSNGTSDHNNTIVSNTFTGGSYGISWFSNTSSIQNYALNLTVDSNTFQNQNNYAVYLYYCNAPKVRKNTITAASTTTYYGIFMSYPYQNPVIGSNTLTISNNTSTAYGIRLNGFNNGGNTSNRGLVINNMVRVGAGSGTSYGLSLDQYVYWSNFLHNTIHNN
jgi:parallel beta-helix repeat protein